MVNEGPGILRELGDKHTQVEVGVATTTNSKVISSGEDVNPMRESPLTTNILLEGSL